MRKKIILLSLVVLSFMLVGCSFNNTPKAKVEEVLMKYQNNSDVVKNELNDYLGTLDISENNLEEYRKIYDRQYANLTYDIKDELIDGDKASVKVQIEVYDYYKTEQDAIRYTTDNAADFITDNMMDIGKVMTYKLDKLFKTNERVTYTIMFNLNKVDDVWTIDKLSNEDLEKIHGIYAH